MKQLYSVIRVVSLAFALIFGVGAWASWHNTGMVDTGYAVRGGIAAVVFVLFMRK